MNNDLTWGFSPSLFINLKQFYTFYDIESEVNIMVNQDDLKRFDELYDNSYRDISKYVVCHCSYIEDVKDILQNIYLDVLKNISRIDNEAYIMAIAKNKVKDYYRFHYKKRIKSLFEKENNSI